VSNSSYKKRSQKRVKDAFTKYHESTARLDNESTVTNIIPLINHPEVN